MLFKTAINALEQAADEVVCFDELSGIINSLPDPGTPEYEKEARKALRKLLRLAQDMKITMKLENLKHIRRELNVILEVLDQQGNAIKQMTNDLNSSMSNCFNISKKISKELRQGQARRKEKLSMRREKIIALDTKAERIYKDVGNPEEGYRMAR